MGETRSVNLLLRLEGPLFAAIALFFFSVTGGSWLLFAVLALAPDLSMLAYLAGPKAGAIVYNLVHTWAAPILAAAIGWFGGYGVLLPVAFIWAVHIGVDRALGFGLKLPTGFQDTHLGRIGR